MTAAGKGRRGPAAAASGGGRVPGRRRAPSGWKKDPEGRQERVLLEATRLFAEQGYAAVSTGDIARAAGVAEGSVFHYFGSKAGLLRAVGARYGAEFTAAMFSGIEPRARPETIEEIVRRAFDFVSGNWPGFGVFLLSDDPSGASLAQQGNREAVTAAVRTVLELWVREGVVEELDAPVVADLLFGLVESALRRCFAGDGGVDRERFERATVAAMSRILGIAVPDHVGG